MDTWTTSFYPGPLVERYVQEWCYAKFCHDAGATRNRFVPHAGSLPRTGAVKGDLECLPEIPDLEAFRLLRQGPTAEIVLGDWKREFDMACETAANWIFERLFDDQPDLEGTYLELPFLPLGTFWTKFMPLVSQSWLDRGLVELCETAARLQSLGFSRIPALDPHSLSWHRFIRRSVRMTATLKPLRTNFTTILKEVKRAIASRCWQQIEINGRPHILIDELRCWNDRVLPAEYLAKDRLLAGINVRAWNRWIEDYGESGVVKRFGLLLAKVDSPFTLRNEESIAHHATFDDAEESLAHRERSIQAIVSVSRSQPNSKGPFHWLTARQKRILQILQDCGELHIGVVAQKIRLSQSAIYKPGALKELVEQQLISRGTKHGMYAITERGRSALPKK